MGTGGAGRDDGVDRELGDLPPRPVRAPDSDPDPDEECLLFAGHPARHDVDLAPGRTTDPGGRTPPVSARPRPGAAQDLDVVACVLLIPVVRMVDWSSSGQTLQRHTHIRGAGRALV